MFGLSITSECSLSWTCISRNCSRGSKWLVGRPFESVFYQFRLPPYMIAFSISVSWLTNIYSECKRQTRTHIHTHTHMHTQTIRAVAGRHSALHPVVSLHASKLFSVTQILIWKSQLTELTETREESKDPLSSFHCPFLFASLLHLTDTFWCRQLLILILCPFHTGWRRALKVIAGHWSASRRGIETSPAIWALDYEARLKPYWSVAVWLWLRNQLFLFTNLMTKWIQTHRNHLTVRAHSLQDTPAESILQCVGSACFALPIVSRGVGVHSPPVCAHHARLIRSTKVRTREWFLCKGWLKRQKSHFLPGPV